MKETQRSKILKVLKEGRLNSYTATYNMKIKQAPTRIKELKELGYKILSLRNKNRSVDWILVGLPLENKAYKFVIGKDNIARRVYS